MRNVIPSLSFSLSLHPSRPPSIVAVLHVSLEQGDRWYPNDPGVERESEREREKERDTEREIDRERESHDDHDSHERKNRPIENQITRKTPVLSHHEI